MALSTQKSRNLAYVKDLASFIDSVGMVYAYQQPRKNARLYAYNDLIGNACSECFRWCDGSIHLFDGRIWVPCTVEEFKYIVRDALVMSAGAGAEVIKSDWVDKERKILEYALDGVKSSPLRRDAHIVAFTNGVWDFSNVEHPVKHKFDERLPVTTLLPYAYNPEATCPVWVSFLNCMLPSVDIETLQKFFGLCYVSRDTISVESSLWLIGSGANGKSTIERVMPLVFGQDAVSHTRLDTLLDRNIDARMRAMATVNGRKFNICEEIADADIERGSDVFKSLVSGQTQQARGIGKDIYDACDIPFLIFTMNQLPKNKKMDNAFRRRMVRIYFRSSVRQEDMDTELIGKLAGELSGIRNWVTEGYKMLARDRFSIAPARHGDELTDDEVDMMISNGHTCDAWVEHAGLYPSMHVGHEKDETGVVIPLSDLYRDYESFCRNKLSVEAVNSQQFGRDLHRLGFEWKRRAGGSHYKVYCDNRNRFVSLGK